MIGKSTADRTYATANIILGGSNVQEVTRLTKKKHTAKKDWQRRDSFGRLRLKKLQKQQPRCWRQITVAYTSNASTYGCGLDQGCRFVIKTY